MTKLNLAPGFVLMIVLAVAVGTSSAVGVQAVTNVNVIEDGSVFIQTSWPSCQTSHAIGQLMAKCGQQLFILLFFYFGPVKL